jgi:endo-1,4-beta-D-glucanase Y
LELPSVWQGFFAWDCEPDGSKLDATPAPDGEAFIATALLFASARWGDGTGYRDYGTVTAITVQPRRERGPSLLFIIK